MEELCNEMRWPKSVLLSLISNKVNHKVCSAKYFVTFKMGCQ